MNRDERAVYRFNQLHRIVKAVLEGEDADFVYEMVLAVAYDKESKRGSKFERSVLYLAKAVADCATPVETHEDYVLRVVGLAMMANRYA